MLSLRALNESLIESLAANPTTAPAADCGDTAMEGEDPFGKERTAGLEGVDPFGKERTANLDNDPPKPPARVESLSAIMARGAQYLKQSRR